MDRFPVTIASSKLTCLRFRLPLLLTGEGIAVPCRGGRSSPPPSSWPLSAALPSEPEEVLLFLGMATGMRLFLLLLLLPLIPVVFIVVGAFGDVFGVILAFMFAVIFGIEVGVGLGLIPGEGMGDISGTA
jgi:hypothetical protein